MVNGYKVPEREMAVPFGEEDEDRPSGPTKFFKDRCLVLFLAPEAD